MTKVPHTMAAVKTPPASSGAFLPALKLLEGTNPANRRSEMNMAIALTRRVLDQVNDLPLLQKAILFVMAFTASTEDGTGVYPKLATLSRQVGCSERAIRNGIQRLERLGYLRKLKRARMHSPAEWQVVVSERETSASRVERAERDAGRERNAVPVSAERRAGLDRNDVPALSKTVPKTVLKDSTETARSFGSKAATPSRGCSFNKPIPSKPSSTSTANEVQAVRDLSVRQRFEARQAEQAAERRRRRA